jgi:hypothetical protein
MYDSVTREFIINRNVQFMENKAWDGRVEKRVNIINVIVHDDT